MNDALCACLNLECAKQIPFRCLGKGGRVDFSRLEIKTDTKQRDFGEHSYPGWYEHRISFWIVGRQYTASFVSERANPNHSECLGGFARCLFSVGEMVAKDSEKLK